MVRFAPFFFFFFLINFGLTQPFWLELAISTVSPVSADTAQVSPIWAASAQVGESTWQDAAQRGIDTRSTAPLLRRRVPPRQTQVRWLWSRIRASQNRNFQHNIITLDRLKDANISYSQIIFICKCRPTSRKWTSSSIPRNQKPHLPWLITNLKHHILSILNIHFLRKGNWYTLHKLHIIILIIN